MPWHAQLDLHYRHQPPRSVAMHRHDGPLRILQSLYPEGPAICHNVLVHPPGGLVGGDTLAMQVHVDPGAHGLVTTPGATRFYRSTGEPARQTAHLHLAQGARLEWLPLEAIAYSGCLAENRLTLDLAPGAELLGWDVTALGLPHAQQPFESGTFTQHIEWPGRWLERGHIAAHDHRLLSSPLGLAGQRCLGALFFATGTPLTRERREQALEGARHTAQASPLAHWTGITCPSEHVVMARVLAPQVEPVMQLLQEIRASWRQTLWGLRAEPPRIWSM
ncbi:MAG: urease accessory protein UreD [Burkholderiaceae bacterium]|nr:urease accessory protein UreD [Burkholderiaceae bacterium]